MVQSKQINNNFYKHYLFNKLKLIEKEYKKKNIPFDENLKTEILKYLNKET
jgi:hypothetical protein